MHASRSALWARSWPAGLGALALALMTAPPAVGATSTDCPAPLAAAGWHGRAIRTPEPRRPTVVAAVSWPRGWSAGSVRRGTGYAAAHGSRRVRELQRRLRARGYRAGPVDGRFGPRTVSALQWFQIKHGLRPGCTADARTVRALRTPLARVQAAEVRQPTDRSIPGGTALAPLRPAVSSADMAVIVALVVVVLLGLAVIAARLGADTARRGGGTTRAGILPPLAPLSGTGGARRLSADAVPAASGVWRRPPEPAVSPRPARPLNALAGRVAGYVTVASDDALPGRLDDAKQVIGLCCRARGLKLAAVVHDVEPRSDRSADRPGLMHVLDRIAAGELSGIVTPRLHDLANSVVGLGTLLRWLAKSDAFVIALDLGLDTTTDAGAAAAGTLVEIAAWERHRIADRTRPGLAAARPPAIADDPALGARIAAMRADGMSLQAIADTLNEEGVPTLRGGYHWRPSSVQTATGYERPSARLRGIDGDRRPAGTEQRPREARA